MPELPEVEATLRTLLISCKGQKIKEMISRESGGGPRESQYDDKIFVAGDGDEGAFRAGFLNRTLLDAKRRGKYLIFFMSGSGPQIVIHYGMTGTLLFKDKPVPSYKSFDANKLGKWPPMYCKFELVFDNGIRVAFTDPRRLGRVKLRNDAFKEPPISLLGHDPLTDRPRLAAGAFHESLVKYSCPIKALLLNQDGVFCGIGNYLADEVCYQSEVSPDKKSKDLTSTESAELLRTIYSVIDTAVDCNNRNVDFPADWLFHFRWGKGKKEESVMPGGEKIKFLTVGGRTTAVVTKKKKSTEAPSVGSSSSKSIKAKNAKKTTSISNSISSDSLNNSTLDSTSPEQKSNTSTRAVKKVSIKVKADAPAVGKVKAEVALATASSGRDKPKSKSPVAKIVKKEVITKSVSLKRSLVDADKYEQSGEISKVKQRNKRNKA